MEILLLLSQRTDRHANVRMSQLVMTHRLSRLSSDKRFNWTADQAQAFKSFVSVNPDFKDLVQEHPSLTKKVLEVSGLAKELYHSIGFGGLENMKKHVAKVSLIDVKICSKILDVYKGLPKERDAKTVKYVPGRRQEEDPSPDRFPSVAAIPTAVPRAKAAEENRPGDHVYDALATPGAFPDSPTNTGIGKVINSFVFSNE